MSAGRHRFSVRESLCFALCTPVAALSFVVLKLPPSHPLSPPVKAFLVCGNFSSITAPSLRCRSHPYSFVSVFSSFFCSNQVRGEFLAFWEVWVLLPVFSRCSVGVVPHVDVVLMYLWEGRWSPHLTPLPFWRSPHQSFLKNYQPLVVFFLHFMSKCGVIFPKFSLCPSSIMTIYKEKRIRQQRDKCIILLFMAISIFSSLFSCLSSLFLPFHRTLLHYFT